MFHKRHYEKIAELIRHEELNLPMIAKMFKEDNPSFDKSVFYEACGYEQE